MQPDFRSPDHFKTFAKQLENAIASYGDDDRTLVERQRSQFLHLTQLEDELRRTLIRHPWGLPVFTAFIEHITSDNILSARPYFRERQRVFTEAISVQLKAGSPIGLYPFHFNYLFVRFALDNMPWAPDSKVARLGKQIERVRKALVEMNMPLAIARSRIFWGKTPPSHLDYMDFVQIAAEGLIVAVDKFCPDAGSLFRHVAIGRMVGFFIEQYSETPVHFFPQDKRKLYRANKAVHRLAQEQGGVDFNKLAEMVNSGAGPDHRTNASEISSLMAASSCVSADAEQKSSEGEKGSTLMDTFVSASENQPDNLAETSDAAAAMRRGVATLNVVEQKLLRLEGVEL